MGGCCFTPRKTQLLWWYWLLLFSVVGIPMFAAALYVQRASGRGMLDRRDVRRASQIFWLGTGLSLLLMGLLLLVILTYVGPPSAGRHWESIGFAVSFIFWLAIAVAAAKTADKVRHRLARPVIVAAYALVPAYLVWLPSALPYRAAMEAWFLVPVSLLKFIVCMLPAHFWHVFAVSPTRRKAWLFVLAMAVGTILFWLVSQYGLDLQMGLYGLLWGGRRA
jgi:hypothetical protein